MKGADGSVLVAGLPEEGVDDSVLPAGPVVIIGAIVAGEYDDVVEGMVMYGMLCGDIVEGVLGAWVIGDGVAAPFAGT